MTEIFLLLILFQIKHFVADYPLQGAYMLGKFKREGWVLPLAAHCGVHAVFTFVIATVFAGVKLAVVAAAIDFVLHFTMDRLKASPDMMGRFKPDNSKFWYALGFDQMVHHVTHYLIIAMIVLR